MRPFCLRLTRLEPNSYDGRVDLAAVIEVGKVERLKWVDFLFFISPDSLISTRWHTVLPCWLGFISFLMNSTSIQEFHAKCIAPYSWHAFDLALITCNDPFCL